jgi:hypothetical protein
MVRNLAGGDDKLIAQLATTASSDVEDRHLPHPPFHTQPVVLFVPPCLTLSPWGWLDGAFQGSSVAGGGP